MKLDVTKFENKSMLFYFMVKRYAPKGQEALTNLPKQKKDTGDKKIRMA